MTVFAAFLGLVLTVIGVRGRGRMSKLLLCTGEGQLRVAVALAMRFQSIDSALCDKIEV